MKITSLWSHALHFERVNENGPMTSWGSKDDHVIEGLVRNDSYGGDRCD